MSIIFTQDQLASLRQRDGKPRGLPESVSNELRIKGSLQVALQGSDSALVESAYQDVRNFFALDARVKDKFQRVSMNGRIVSYSTREPDIDGVREALDIMSLRQKTGGVVTSKALENIWKADRSPLMAVRNIMGKIVQDILYGIETYLPDGYASIEQYDARLGDKMRGLFYQKGGRMESHTDNDLLTVLHARQTGVSVNYEEKAVNQDVFTVIVGKQLEQISEDFFWATAHEVNATCERQSLAYFYGISKEVARPKVA
ncbi:MAG: 2OG-Fe(II) oxygenase family protein [Bdellovibrionales bacterium]